MGSIRVGMSGFSYPEWVGDFYPAGTKQKDMLARYAERFDAVEINVTFRRQVAETTLVRWRDAVPADFRFTLKAHRFITHYKRLVDTEDDVARFVVTARSLGPRLGAILYQTPAKLEWNEETAEAFLSSLPRDVPHVIEPRHADAKGDVVDALLGRFGVARCVNDDVLDDLTYRLTGPVAYFRFHRTGYTAEDLDERARLVRRLASEGADVFAFFAHEDDPASTGPALRFRELVAS